MTTYFKELKMAKRAFYEEEKNLRFLEVSKDILSDVLTNLNNRNKCYLENVTSVCGNLIDCQTAECVFHICAELRLGPVVGFYAIEILNRFMATYLEDLLLRQKRQSRKDASCEDTGDYIDLIYQTLKEKFIVLMLSSVQIASKLHLYSNVVDNNIAMSFLHRVSFPCSKEKLLDSEIFILKTLKFNLNVPNALTYVETLLEVLGHNDPTVPVAQLHNLCVDVLQFIYLQREAIYNSLLTYITGYPNPSHEHRAMFASVPEDFMLLGVGVIVVAAFIHLVSGTKKVVDELTEITGISGESMRAFAYVTLMNITQMKPV